jgi:hypothetical protein
MIRPCLPSGIKNRDKLPGFAIESADLAPFRPVAVEARPCQVVIAIATAMLARRDMIRFMALDGMILVKVAVLATKSGSLGNSQALRDGN